jgi:hypothetical protein
MCIARNYATTMPDLQPHPPFTGSCLCGAVRYEITGALRDVIVCHCNMCRKSHGHISAYSAASRDAVRLIESRGLKWYRLSERSRQGFCGECGGTLFWDADGRDTISIAAGTLDAPTGLRTTLQIYVDSKGDYYDVDATIPIRGA